MARWRIVSREVVTVRIEHPNHLGACCRLKILPGDKCDDLMTFVAPGEGVRCRSIEQSTPAKSPMRLAAIG
jgi:hypothetical protein